MRSSIRRFNEKRNRVQLASSENAKKAPRINSTLTNDQMDIVSSISRRLKTGLNDRALSAIVDLLLAGVSPDAIVATITSLDQSVTRMKNSS